MKVIDPGHEYHLLNLDGAHSFVPHRRLTFVKRHDPNDPSKYPGNTNSHEGTTLQSVIRCLLNRMRYLQNQIWAAENVPIIFFLRCCLWLLEARAARRHHRWYFKSLDFAEFAEMCQTCGHTGCTKH